MTNWGLWGFTFSESLRLMMFQKMWHRGMLFKVEHPYVVSGGIWWQYCDGAFCGSCVLDYTGTLYCVTTCVTFHSGNFPWWQGAQWLVLFSLLCVGVHTVLPSVLQSMLGVYLSYLKKVLEAVHFGLQTCFVQNKHAVHCTLKLLLMTLKHILNAYLQVIFIL